ncbi:MAG: glycosyl transferase family 90 [Roseobacter sp.]
MEHDAFIQRSVDLQLGEVCLANLTESDLAAAAALNGASGQGVIWRQKLTNAGGPDVKHLSPTEGVSALGTISPDVKTAKSSSALTEILAAGAEFDFLVDMQDRRLRRVVGPSGDTFPTFTFNRKIGDKGRILWPLLGYHSLGEPSFLGPCDWGDIPWAHKKDIVAWRGALNGRADWHGDVSKEGMRYRAVLKSFRSGKMSLSDARRTLEAFPRHRLVSRYINDARFDIGFTDAGGGLSMGDFPFLRNLVRARVEMADFQRHKYLLVLKGMDVSSAFYWTMNSGSLGLVMDGVFETFASGHFKPWEHYVPFRADLNNLEERLEWCHENQNECEQMTHRARDICSLIGSRDLREKISKKIVRSVSDALERN